jgi:hypothetical protein
LRLFGLFYRKDRKVLAKERKGCSFNSETAPVPRITLDRALHSLHIQHAGHAFNRIDNLIQVLYIKHLDGDFDMPFLIGSY